jgi:hypothetical protein
VRLDCVADAAVGGRDLGEIPGELVSGEDAGGVRSSRFEDD